jgi:hypothetical protein
VKITARLAGTASLTRLDLSRLVQRLTSAIQREGQDNVPLQSPSPRLRQV